MPSSLALSVTDHCRSGILDGVILTVRVRLKCFYLLLLRLPFYWCTIYFNCIVDNLTHFKKAVCSVCDVSRNFVSTRDLEIIYFNLKCFLM